MTLHEEKTTIPTMPTANAIGTGDIPSAAVTHDPRTRLALECPPSVSAALDERRDEAEQADGDRHNPGRSKPYVSGTAIAGIFNQEDAGHQSGQTKRDVDIEGPPPAELGRQPPAEKWAGGSHASDDRPPHIPKAIARARPRNDTLTIDRVAGRIIAAPTPWSAGHYEARDHRSWQQGSWPPQTPRVRSERAACAPHVTDPAQCDEKSREHERIGCVDPLGVRHLQVRFVMMVGSETLMIVMSITIIATPIPRTTKPHQRRLLLCESSAGAG